MFLIINDIFSYNLDNLILMSIDRFGNDINGPTYNVRMDFPGLSVVILKHRRGNRGDLDLGKIVHTLSELQASGKVLTVSLHNGEVYYKSGRKMTIHHLTLNWWNSPNPMQETDKWI